MKMPIFVKEKFPIIICEKSLFNQLYCLKTEKKHLCIARDYPFLLRYPILIGKFTYIRVGDNTQARAYTGISCIEESIKGDWQDLACLQDPQA